jgi:predicted dehydrogenase
MAKVGIVGCGRISNVYFRNARRFEALEVVACTDAIAERARQAASDHDVEVASSLKELLADERIEIVANLTPPQAHAAVSQAALASGKSVYSEKPLALEMVSASHLLDEAHDANLAIGCAPDTFLGAAAQTARKLVDDGTIGEPVAASAFMVSRGPEVSHPAPHSYYQPPGGGPLFNRGPYCLTTLVSLLGPIRRVAGLARRSFEERVVLVGPDAGRKITPEVPTHVTGHLEFKEGPIATLITSFDVRYARVPHIEIYGSEGTLSLPDPTHYGGPVYLRRGNEKEWNQAPQSHAYTDDSHGLGMADLAQALISGRHPRATGQLAFHVLEVILSLQDATSSGTQRMVSSTCERPTPLPIGLADGMLDP